MVVAHNSGGPKMDILINTGFLCQSAQEYADSMDLALAATPAQRQESRDSSRRFMQFKKQWNNIIVQ